jgi:molybdate transport system substrate-binding protein
MTKMKKSVALIWSLAATSMLFVPISAACGADLVVLSAAATKTAVAGVPALVEATSGDHVRFVFGTAGAIRDLATAGDPFDVIIAPPPVLADLIANGLVVAGSRKPLGIVRLGAAFSKPGPRPAIDTPEALKSALLEARSVGMADPAKGATSVQPPGFISISFFLRWQ